MVGLRGNGEQEQVPRLSPLAGRATLAASFFEAANGVEMSYVYGAPGDNNATDSQDTMEMEAHLRFLNMDLEMEVLDLESCLNVGDEFSRRTDSIEMSGSRLSLRGELAKTRETRHHEASLSQRRRRLRVKSPQVQEEMIGDEAPEPHEVVNVHRMQVEMLVFPEPFEPSEERLLLSDETDGVEASTGDQALDKPLVLEELGRKRKLSANESREKRPRVKAGARVESLLEKTTGDDDVVVGEETQGTCRKRERGSLKSKERLENSLEQQQVEAIQKEKCETSEKVENTQAGEVNLASTQTGEEKLENTQTGEVKLENTHAKSSILTSTDDPEKGGNKFQRKPETRSARKRLREKLPSSGSGESLVKKPGRGKKMRVGNEELAGSREAAPETGRSRDEDAPTGEMERSFRVKKSAGENDRGVSGLMSGENKPGSNTSAAAASGSPSKDRSGALDDEAKMKSKAKAKVKLESKLGEPLKTRKEGRLGIPSTNRVTRSRGLEARGLETTVKDEAKSRTETTESKLGEASESQKERRPVSPSTHRVTRSRGRRGEANEKDEATETTTGSEVNKKNEETQRLQSGVNEEDEAQQLQASKSPETSTTGTNEKLVQGEERAQAAAVVPRGQSKTKRKRGELLEE